MTQTVYTNYWQNRIGNIQKEYGSYKSEEEAIVRINKARNYVYDSEGRLIRRLEENIRTNSSASFKNKIPNLNIFI